MATAIELEADLAGGNQQEELRDLKGMLTALDRVQAVIEFSMDGTILTANDNFLTLLGYRLDEVQSRHHRMFVEPAFAASEEYRRFWARLNAGEFQAAEFKRIGKGGKEVWIQASYNPVLDERNRPVKVVKFAIDVTETKLRAAEAAGQLAAISKSMAVIEFQLDGAVITANDNFLKVLGYRLDEIRGRHHRMFVEAGYAASREYQQFWTALNAGQYQAGEFKRIGKGGKEAWIQASYNPILDLNGRPFKVVKFAIDTTEVRQIMNAVVANSRTLTNSADQLRGISQEMGLTARKTSEQAGVVAAASEQVSRNVQTVATGSEEMTASIREIAKNAADAARVATNAVKVAEVADTTVGKLGESSAEIGKVIKVITSIAQQTNLLALNATIEAARAGEAGRGFAVVANEVKELAKETARATEEIGRKIAAIQTDTTQAVTAIREIGGIIGQINDIQTAIAGAVEEQTATTNEMSRNVTEAAQGTDEIASNIAQVGMAAHTTTEGANRTLQAAEEQARLAAELSRLTARFTD